MENTDKKTFNWNGILGGVVGGLSNLASTWLQSKYNKQSQDAQNKANMQLAKYQYDQQMDMWNKANLYNSPESQMTRFKQAGLNPNLIYGQGNSGNTPNVLPQYHSPDISAKKFSPVNPSEIVSETLNNIATSERIKILKAERRSKEQDAIKKEASEPYYTGMARNQDIILNQRMFQEQLKGLLAQWEKDAMSIYNPKTGMQIIKPEVQPLWASHLLGKYSRNEAMLNQYNSNIALANSRKDLLDLDIANYVPKWLQSMVSFASGIKGSFPSKAKVPKGYVQTGQNLGGGAYKTLRKSIY